MDYQKYKCNIVEMIRAMIEYAALNFLLSYFFFRSWIVFVIMTPGFFLYIKLYKKRLVESRKQKLSNEFSEMLYSVSIGMKSGKSIENSFIDSREDMKMFYGEKSLMLIELNRIKVGLELNKTLEELIEDLSHRADIEDISLFSEVFKCAKRNGGNITEVLSETADRIRKKIVVESEIKTIMSERRLEVRIMEAVPFIILVYVNLTSKGYFDVLYEGINGRIIMSGCLVIYILAILIADYIMRIQV